MIRPGAATILCEGGIQRIVRGLPFALDDGGRATSGFKGQAGDCVCRAIAIATEKPYLDVYVHLNTFAERERPRRGKQRSSARSGVFKPTIHKYLQHLGWRWMPTMSIGSGCSVHLREGEVPGGRLIVSLSRHLVAVVDGVVHDLSDPCRGGMRCVYGYWLPPVESVP